MPFNECCWANAAEQCVTGGDDTSSVHGGVAVAHTAVITGLDWSHTSASRLVTCSTDRTAKLWSTTTASNSSSSGSGSIINGAVVSSGDSSSSVGAISGTGSSSGSGIAAPLLPLAILQRDQPLQRVMFAPFGQGVVTVSNGLNSNG
jgi:WD40 repeat protein